MVQRGVSSVEIEQTIRTGWPATDTRPGTQGRVMIFPFQDYWLGRFYDEKEVTVY